MNPKTNKQLRINFNNLKWVLLSFIVIVLDQWSKYAAVGTLNLYQQKIILPVFNLTLAHNQGAAFGFLNQHPQVAMWLFTAIGVFASGIIIGLLCRLLPGRAISACSLALILGGALGNVWDRLTYGYVIDFLEFHYQAWYFPVFNIADVAITLGAFGLIWQGFLRKEALFHD